MKRFFLFCLILFLTGGLIVTCKKPVRPEDQKPTLIITLKTDSGKSIAGVPVRLYRNANDTGIIQMSDSTGVAVFSELDTVLYYWLAQQGCKTNRVSQTSLNRPLRPNAVHYGYSVLVETGTVKIINTSPEPYIVSDSLVRITVKKDSPYIAPRRVRSYLVRTEKPSTPGSGKDTLIRIKCADTLTLKIPF